MNREPQARTPLPEWLAQTLPDSAAAPGVTQDAARQQVVQWGLPTLRDEEWRWTNLRSLGRQAFSTPAVAVATLPDNPLAAILPDALVVTFVDGQLQGLPTDLPAGLKLVALANCDEALRAAAFAPEARNPNDALLALNTASATQGVVIDVAANAVIDRPVVIRWLEGTQAEAYSQTRVFVRLGVSAQATVIESVSGINAQLCWRNGITVIDQAANSQLHHLNLGLDGDHHLLTTRDFVRLARDARYHALSLQLAGQLVRREIDVDITDTGAHCELLGLMMPRGKQVLDTHTRIVHGAPQTTSSEHYRTIADESGRGIFKGRILVAQDAQQIAAFQDSRNLLLSDQAEIDTKPELEIYADDVKCSHGATVGRLDSEALYYLQSRGIPFAQARNLLIVGFAQELIDAAPVPALVEWLTEQVSRRLGTERLPA
ncbi:Fe-S cluster assembly protein SufD [Halothiobacillus diazotrophicus]|uniref:Fe-S cluster assembly protein SufD n=1 Tax=Halothiobacillus diazotrophicus TaxID=1860122 RepID=A0A191ZEN6_9GAMM|nr:Fe-S cluster assembly protein SufD [Halothiobacillus diazotrophicus]ANJ66327.1 Fe-S cluster assembly protein SufD [Halothiobacillus diazotrophicus]